MILHRLLKLPSSLFAVISEMKTVCKAAMSLVFVLVASTVFAQDKPNIVYILVDNWGWGDIGIQGGTVPTPRIDKLASEGIRLTNL